MKKPNIISEAPDEELSSNYPSELPNSKICNGCGHKLSIKYFNDHSEKCYMCENEIMAKEKL